MVQFDIYRGGFWFRVLGFGVSVRDKKRFPPLFSERCGSRHMYRIGKWGIEFLAKRVH